MPVAGYGLFLTGPEEFRRQRKRERSGNIAQEFRQNKQMLDHVCTSIQNPAQSSLPHCSAKHKQKGHLERTQPSLGQVKHVASQEEQIMSQ